MTAYGRSRARGRASGLEQHFQISDRQMLVLVLAMAALAGWHTLASLLVLAQSDTPLSFTALVPIIGTAFILKRFDASAIRSRPHDSFVDGIFFTLLVLASAVLLVLLPITMSWYYWLERLDVPGLILLLTAVIVRVWGLPGVIRLAPALLYFLLAWPLPALTLDNHILGPLTTLTALAAGHVAQSLPLGIRMDPSSATMLHIPFAGHTTTLIIAQACSGINGSLGLVVVALPLALLGRGTWEAKLGWLALGAGISWLVNTLRITTIAGSAAIWGPQPTMNLLHPVAGLALFALSFAGLLAVAPRCGLDVGSAWQKTRSGHPVPAEKLGARRAGVLLAIIAAATLAEANLSQFSWLDESSLPRVGLAKASDLFHAPRGWRVLSSQSIPFWTPYFGSSAVASVMTLGGHGGTPVVVQAILTKDKQSFSAYGVENCYVFHGYSVQSVQRVTLGNGLTATLVDFLHSGAPTATLYWIQPVQTPRGLYHERVLLISGAYRAPRDAVKTAGDGAPGVFQPVQSLGTTLANVLSPWGGRTASPEYRYENAQLENLGQTTVAMERHTG